MRRQLTVFKDNISYSEPSLDIAAYSELKGTLCTLKKPKKCWKKARKAKLTSTHTHALSTTSYPQSTYTWLRTSLLLLCREASKLFFRQYRVSFFRFQNVVLFWNVLSFSKCKRFCECYFPFSEKHNCKQKSVHSLQIALLMRL